MKLHIQHRTVYQYDAPANYSIQTLKLTPRRDGAQRSVTWRLTSPGRRVEQVDAFGNVTHLVTLEGPHNEVAIQAEGLVETDAAFVGIVPHEGGLSPLAFSAPTTLTRSNEAIESLSRRVFGRGPATSANVTSLVDAVADAVKYQPGATGVSDPATEAISRGAGVCQDQTHVAIATCRAAGIPARYVSGYVYLDDEEHAASHAWVDVWVASENVWVSCDVTHRVRANPQLCRLAVGRDYLDAAPVRGVRRGGGREKLVVHVIVSAQQQ